MSQQRSISRVVNVPPAAPGFVGPGHLAAPVVSPENFEMNDPFILLMDDHLDIGDRPVGGPHPHAGFETVTLILDGAIFDRDEGGTLREAGFARGLPFETGLRALRKDGKYHWLLLRFNPFRDEEERLVRWYATGTDIDDRKRAEDRKRKRCVARRHRTLIHVQRNRRFLRAIASRAGSSFQGSSDGFHGLNLG